MMPRWLTPDWRRTVLALTFAAAGGALTLFALWLAWRVIDGPWPVTLAGAQLAITGNALYAVLGLLGVVITGLAMTVALRQVNAKFAGGEVNLSGGPEHPGNGAGGGA